MKIVFLYHEMRKSRYLGQRNMLAKTYREEYHMPYYLIDCMREKRREEKSAGKQKIESVTVWEGTHLPMNVESRP